MEKDSNNDNKYSSMLCCGPHSGSSAFGWGAFFIILGGYFLAQELGYISTGVSIWPVLLVAFGVYLVVKNLGR